MSSIFRIIKKTTFLLSVHFLSRLPVVSLIFWLNAYSIIKLFSFSAIFVGIFFLLKPLTVHPSSFHFAKVSAEEYLRTTQGSF